MNTIISFELCPFVQRSLITLNYKNAEYDIKYIDLENKPDWFLEISPMGKVPVMQVGDEVLFESAVINEFVDETHGSPLLPKDPLKKAKERAYIELSSAVTMSYFLTASATTKENYETEKKSLEKNLTSMLKPFQGPFFRGEEFSLVDTSAIPALQRLMLTDNLYTDLDLDESTQTKLAAWLENTLSMDAVRKSVPEAFEAKYKQYLVEKKSFIHNRR